MAHQKLQQYKRRLRRLWVLSPERLWLASIALAGRGHWLLAFWLKQLNGLIYHNSLAPGATVSPDVFLAHNSLGIVVNRNVEIGSGVTIWHNVTLAAGLVERPRRRAEQAVGREIPPAVRSRIIVEDDVKIGANAVVIAPRGRTVRIGRGAAIGAGTVVTADVPPGRVVVSAPARLQPVRPAPAGFAGEDRERDPGASPAASQRGVAGADEPSLAHTDGRTVAPLDE